MRGCARPVRRNIRVRWQRSFAPPIIWSSDSLTPRKTICPPPTMPFGTTSRRTNRSMVRLFVSLGHEAGLIPEEKLPNRRPRKPRQPSSQRPSNQQTGRPDAAADEGPRPEKGTTPPDYHQTERSNAAAVGGSRPEKGGTPPDYSLANVHIQQLPGDGIWTKAHRDLWIQAMTSAVDLLVEVVPESE